jgi:hypothetical protein
LTKRQYYDIVVGMPISSLDALNLVPALVPPSRFLRSATQNSGKQRKNSQHHAVFSFAKPSVVQDFREV